VHTLWSEGFRVWSPEGPNSPNIALLAIDVKVAKVWTKPASALTYALYYLRARRLISQKRKPSNPNGKLAVMSLWVKSGHMQCNNPCLLWARSGHRGITQLLIIFPSVLDRFRGSRHTQTRQRVENATHLRQMGLLSIASRPPPAVSWPSQRNRPNCRDKSPKRTLPEQKDRLAAVSLYRLTTTPIIHTIY
jgi:hypothetical protein